MSTQEDPRIKQTTPPRNSSASVLKFVNDYKKDMEGLRIRSFYLFHRCSHSCVKDIEANNDKV